MRGVLRLFMAGCLVSSGMAPAFAQDFPSKTVHIVVPWPPGGPPDLAARVVVSKLNEALGITAIVENRPGATGSIGTQAVLKSAPDGHTLLITSSQPIVMAPVLFRTPYDPLTDIRTVAVFGESTNVLITSPSLGINSVADLIALARAKPGALTFSSAGQGSIGHFCGEIIKHIAGIDMLHVPYPGTTKAVTALLAGEVSFNCSSHLLAAPHIKSGKLKALGVTGLKPSVYLPDTPPLASQGLKDLSVTAWYGVFAPPKIAPPTMRRVRDVMQKVFNEPDVQLRLQDAGMERRWEEDEESAARIAADLARYRAVVQAAGIKAQ